MGAACSVLTCLLEAKEETYCPTSLVLISTTSAPCCSCSPPLIPPVEASAVTQWGSSFSNRDKSCDLSLWQLGSSVPTEFSANLSCLEILLLFLSLIQPRLNRGHSPSACLPVFSLFSSPPPPPHYSIKQAGGGGSHLSPSAPLCLSKH